MNQLLFITAERCGLQDESLLHNLVQHARTLKRPVLDLILESNAVDERRFLHELSQNFMLHFWEPDAGWQWTPSLACLLSAEDALNHALVPVGATPPDSEHPRGVLELATYNPFERRRAERLAGFHGLDLRLFITTRAAVATGLTALYGGPVRTTPASGMKSAA